MNTEISTLFLTPEALIKGCFIREQGRVKRVEWATNIVYSSFGMPNFPRKSGNVEYYYHITVYYHNGYEDFFDAPDELVPLKDYLKRCCAFNHVKFVESIHIEDRC